MCVCPYAYTCVEAKGQAERVSPFLLPCGSWGLYQGSQKGLPKMPLTTEPFHAGPQTPWFASGDTYLVLLYNTTI